MLERKRNVTVEYEGIKTNFECASNPLADNSRLNADLSQLVDSIIKYEFPFLKNTSMLHDMALYAIKEKMNTIQTMQNVLSYIKEANVKKVDEISFKNGDINIKCSI